MMSAAEFRSRSGVETVIDLKFGEFLNHCTEGAVAALPEGPAQNPDAKQVNAWREDLSSIIETARTDKADFYLLIPPSATRANTAGSRLSHRRSAPLRQD